MKTPTSAPSLRPALVVLLSATCLAAVALAGCSGGTASPDPGSDGASGSSGSSGSSGTGIEPPSCSFTGTPPAAPTANAKSTVQEIAEDRARAKLDRLVGRFLRREAVIYSGTIEAHDTQSLGQPPPPPGQAGFTDQTIVRQDAFATLTREKEVVMQGTSFPEADLLAVHGVTSAQYVTFAQVKSQAGVTLVGQILGENSSGGNTATCSGCAPTFSELPAKIALDGLTAKATIPITDGSGTKKDATFEVDATATLDAVPVCALTFEQLNHAKDPKFVAAGDEMVFHDEGVADIPASSRGSCGGTAYTIDLYVNRKNLASYGVRNFVAGKVGVTCPP